MSNCKSKCVLASFAPLPMCSSGEDAACIIEVINEANLWTVCEQKNYAMTYPGDVMTVAGTMKNLSSRTLKHMTIGVWTFFPHVKEEIYDYYGLS